jgi:REP element-mobilizing transposase RayT
MPKGLARYQKCGVFHFLTFSCYRRQPLLAGESAYSVFEHELEWVRRRYGFVVAGYVLMPEHVHLLVGETSVSSLSVAMQVLKQQTSRKLKKREEPQFWQPGAPSFPQFHRGKDGIPRTPKRASAVRPTAGGLQNITLPRRTIEMISRSGQY